MRDLGDVDLIYDVKTRATALKSAFESGSPLVLVQSLHLLPVRLESAWQLPVKHTNSTLSNQNSSKRNLVCIAVPAHLSLISWQSLDAKLAKSHINPISTRMFGPIDDELQQHSNFQGKR